MYIKGFFTKKNDAIIDILSGIKNYHIYMTLGWQDVLTRYRRSRIGAFWLTINMMVMICVLWAVFGTIFRAPVAQFLPSLTIGIIVWGLISSLIIEGAQSFIFAQEMILQVRLPLTTHILRVLWRNLIITGHNAVIAPIVFLIFMRPVHGIAIASIFGLFLVIINAFWMMLILAIVCTRYRDLVQIVQNAMQVLFYATPIIWNQDMLPGRYSIFILNMNPFYHLLNIVREPILGRPASIENWLVSILMACVGNAIAIAFFSKYRNRVSYWL